MLVRMPTGSTRPMLIAAGETVAGVKRRVEADEGIPRHRQVIKFANHRLAANQTLADCGVGPGATLQVALTAEAGFSLFVNTLSGKPPDVQCRTRHDDRGAQDQVLRQAGHRARPDASGVLRPPARRPTHARRLRHRRRLHAPPHHAPIRELSLFVFFFLTGTIFRSRPRYILAFFSCEQNFSPTTFGPRPSSMQQPSSRKAGTPAPKKKTRGETHTPRNKEFPAAHAPAWRWDFRGVRTTLDVDISGSTNRSDPKQHRA